VRGTLVLVALALALGFVAGVSQMAAARPSPACVDPKAMYGGTTTCGGLVCVDENLNGKFDGNECIYFLCPECGCGEPCPPPY
jgi:hypothetical protein